MSKNEEAPPTLLWNPDPAWDELNQPGAIENEQSAEHDKSVLPIGRAALNEADLKSPGVDVPAAKAKFWG